MEEVFFLAGPTAVGKSTLAVDLAERCDAEIVSGDAFQIYRGLPILSGQPEAGLLRRVRHHLVGTVSLEEEMSAMKFRSLSQAALADIRARGKRALVVGGSGLYLKALMGGFDMPAPAPGLRRQIAVLPLNDAVKRLEQIDPQRALRTDLKNPRRVTRALEIALSVLPNEVQRSRAAGFRETKRDPSTEHRFASDDGRGVLLVRDRDDLYRRINERVNAMFYGRVKEEVCAISHAGATASRAIGFEKIREMLAGTIPEGNCITQMQQATRRYAKRQLTWFRRQTSFPEFNLTNLGYQEAVTAISKLIARE